MPAIKDMWRDAVNRIAATNNPDVHRLVFAERDKGGGVSAHFALERLAALPEDDKVHLGNFIAYLIWAKLTRDHDGQGVDRYLGNSDLHAFLRAKDYSDAATNKLLAGHGVNTPLGDLRAWLCARAGAKTQLYQHDQLDNHHLELDIEELRWKPPQCVLDDIKKTFRQKRDARSALENWRKKAVGQLRPYVARGIPLLIQGWAMIIAGQLAAGSCNCPERFYETPSLKSAGEKRCRHSHFLSTVNLDAALNRSLPQQKVEIKDPLEYVERAVVEKVHMILQKTFATTMLANVFVTPDGNTIRQRAWNGRTILTETGREFLFDDQEFAEVQSASPGNHPVLGCDVCKQFVGDHASVMHCAGHPLWYGTVDPQTAGDYGDIKINICQGAHPWLGKQGICPTCDQSATQRQIKVPFFFPRAGKFSDVDWAESFPPGRRST